MTKRMVFSIEHREKLRQAHLKNPNRYWLGKKRPDMVGDKNVAKRSEVKEKIRKSLTGKKLSKSHVEKLKKCHIGHFPSAETRLKMRKSSKSGSQSPLWRGGVNPESRKARTSIEYDLWRSAVFARDGFICQKCTKKGGKLRPHHILNFSDWVAIRFAIDNGITLCDHCHRLFHKKYGTRKNTREQLEEFLNIKAQ